MKASIWKWLILVVATAWSVALIAPPKEKVKLGLDLQGGTSYTLEIDDTEGIVGGVSDARGHGQNSCGRSGFKRPPLQRSRTSHG